MITQTVPANPDHLNDEDTLRKAGSKSDVYEAFRRMLSRGEVPDGIEALLRESRESTHS